MSSKLALFAAASMAVFVVALPHTGHILQFCTSAHASFFLLFCTSPCLINCCRQLYAERRWKQAIQDVVEWCSFLCSSCRDRSYLQPTSDYWFCSHHPELVSVQLVVCNVISNGLYRSTAQMACCDNAGNCNGMCSHSLWHCLTDANFFHRQASF